MELNIIISEIKKYDKIAVSGPQRSGTRFTSQVLSKILDYEYVDEGDFNSNNLNEMIDLTKNKKCVVQCPYLSHVVHKIPDEFAIIFMIRNIYDIISSEERVDWQKHREIVKSFYKDLEDKVEIDFTDPISYIKYKCWFEYQKQIIGNRSFELDYESMKETKYWIDKIDRKNFDAYQTTKNKEIKIIDLEK